MKDDDLLIVKDMKGGLINPIIRNPEVHMTYEEWMIIQNLLWSECRDLEASLKLYPDKDANSKTHEFVEKNKLRLLEIGDKIDIYIDRENDHPLWWKRKDPVGYWKKRWNKEEK